jgi:predicted transcriptional regulator
MKIKSFVQGIDQCELAQQQYKQEAVALFLLMGMPSLLSASGIFWQDHRNFRQQEQNRLRATFFNLLQENNGHITTLRFAMAAGLEGRVAKAYLDDWAKEFNAAYNISEEGNVIYHFDLGDADRQFPESI